MIKGKVQIFTFKSVKESVLPITHIQTNHSNSVGGGPRVFSLPLIPDNSMDELMSKIRNTPYEAL